MIHKALILVIAVLGCCVVSHAQLSDTVWIVTGDTYLGEGFKKWRPEMVLDARRTFVDARNSRLWGLRLGMEYKRVHRWGIGLYGLDQPITYTDFVNDGLAVDTAHFNFSYVSLFYERVLWFHPKWEWSAAIHLGAGEITGNQKLSGAEQFEILDPISVSPLELSTSAYYNFTWWLSGGGGMGYRYMRRTQPEVRDVYNGVVYIVKLKIRFGKVVKRIFNEDVKNEY